MIRLQFKRVLVADAAIVCLIISIEQFAQYSCTRSAIQRDNAYVNTQLLNDETIVNRRAGRATTEKSVNAYS